MNDRRDPTEGLTVLGATVQHPIPHVEVFPAPDHVTTVRFATEELASICPVTNQPDLSRVVIEYDPASYCIESKSLKLYLWGFRDRAVFAEALAAETHVVRELGVDRLDEFDRGTGGDGHGVPFGRQAG